MLLQHLRLVDGTGELHEDVDLRVRDGRFAEIGAGLAQGSENVEDLGGATVIPGLFDAHTHITLDPTPGSRQAERPPTRQALAASKRVAGLLACGVTSARDVGGVGPDVIFAVRDAVRDGDTAGPRIFSAGRWMTATGGHGWDIGVEVDDAAALRKAVRTEIKLGANLIKFMVSGGVLGRGLGPQAVQFSEEEIRIGVTEARGAGLTTAAHAHGEASVQAAIRGGITTVEHGTYLTEALAAEMVEKGIFLTPTLAIITLITDAGEGSGIDPQSLERAHEVGEVQRANIGMAFRAGITLLAGTDMGATFAGPDTIHQEIAELVGIGLSELQAIRAATLEPARALGIDEDLGSVQPGRRADLVVLGADPLADIRNTRSIQRVMKDGAWVA